MGGGGGITGLNVPIFMIVSSQSGYDCITSVNFEIVKVPVINFKGKENPKGYGVHKNCNGASCP